MEFTSSLTEAILLKRYKRFLADVAVSKTDRRTIYCPNTGAMRGCNILGSRVWFSSSTNLRRKYPDTWELVEIDGGYLVAINTQRTNQLILEAIASGTITEIQGYKNIEREYALTHYNNRFDFRFSNHEYDKTPCFMEVKAVTLGDEICRGFYPDSNAEITTHQLKALIQL
ncbi:MAG TPA: DNA/RNA nuclease SfsA, partial [Gammaproteobacteria bacterium]|nr:DNA/RNA nuclease SfsA [Gammaproteobacteria bacterium]